MWWIYFSVFHVSKGQPQDAETLWWSECFLPSWIEGKPLFGLSTVLLILYVAAYKTRNLFCISTSWQSSLDRRSIEINLFFPTSQLLCTTIKDESGYRRLSNALRFLKILFVLDIIRLHLEAPPILGWSEKPYYREMENTETDCWGQNAWFIMQI